LHKGEGEDEEKNRQVKGCSQFDKKPYLTTVGWLVTILLWQNCCSPLQYGKPWPHHERAAMRRVATSPVLT
jgi:hypothetical protein